MHGGREGLSHIQMRENDGLGRVWKSSMWYGFKNYALGTPTLCLPVQHHPTHADYGDFTIDLRSCIFNVGLLLMSSMEGEERDMMFSDQEMGRSMGHSIGHSMGCKGIYSGALENLVKICLGLDAIALLQPTSEIPEIYWIVSKTVSSCRQSMKHCNPNKAAKCSIQLCFNSDLLHD